ncbi:hypothetical protein EZS27_019125, partial [termite gut metagenome]
MEIPSFGKRAYNLRVFECFKN